MDFGLSALIGGSFGEVVKTVGGAVGTVAGTGPVKEWVGGVRIRMAGRLPLPENHDLVRGIRTAHLTAVDKVARRHAAVLDTLPAQEIGSDERPFAAFVRGWLDERLKLLRAGAVDFGVVDEAGVARVLDEMVHPSAIEGYAETARQARGRAEDAALAEIAADAGRPAPPLFGRLFRGEAAPGWYETFALFVNERIKTDERFRSIFLAAELVDIKRLVAAAEKAIAAALLRGAEQLDRVENTLGAVKDDTSVIRAMVEELVARQGGASEAERSALLRQIEETRGAHDLTLQAIAGFFRDVGETPLAPADYPRQFAAFAERYRALLAEAERRTNLPAAFEAERGRAAEAIRAGALDEADTILRALGVRLAAWRREQQEMLEQTARDEAAVLTERAAIARTRLRYLEAAALHAEAAALMASDGEAAWRHTMEAASALHDQGQEFGENAALVQAIATYGRALALTPPERPALNWATTLNDLGAALSTLGERESGTARLEEAVRAYRAALEERTRERVPFDWAATQNNLGLALRLLGERESGTARLEEAVQAHRAALEELTRERVPLEWAATQKNLSAVLFRLGERESGTARLEEAARACQATLEEWTRERVPLNWATTQNSLGNALRALGERESGTARLEEAVRAFQAALEEWTRERVPLDWAMTQTNLGNALLRLGEREEGTVWLEEAVRAFRAALEEWTRELAPLQWAMLQNNLGAALSTLGQRKGDKARLEEAVRAFRAALEEWTRERVPLDWAATQSNLGGALSMLSEGESGTARLEEAIRAFHDALEERTRERVPFIWARTIENVARAEAVLGERTGDRARWRDALEHAEAALAEYTRAGAEHYIGKATHLRNYLRDKLSATG